MKKSLIILIAAAAALSACSATDEKVRADQGAIAKDNTAIAKQNKNIDVNRAQKARAKAEGDPIDQANESVQIGVNKTVRGAKKVEREVDEEILEQRLEQNQ